MSGLGNRGFTRIFEQSPPTKIMADEKPVDQVTKDMEELSFDPTMKKKKPSRKKSVSFEDPSTAEVLPKAAPAEEGIHLWSRRLICYRKRRGSLCGQKEKG